MPLKKIIFLTFSGVALGLLGLAGFIIILTSTQNKLNDATETRYLSYAAADELRQSSDDLTRLARTYVISGDDKYEAMYWRVLAIRNGKVARPENYGRIYWNFVLYEGEMPRPNGRKVALKTIMENLGFTSEEFGLLQQAQANSDSLVSTETVAMNAMKGLFDDGTGAYVKIGPPDQQLAIRIMHDGKYHQDKLRIMAPLDEFFAKLDARTFARTEQLKNKAHLLLVSAQVGAVLLSIITLVLVYWGTQYVWNIVGGEPDEIARLAQSVAKGNFDLAVQQKNPTGILKAIVEMAQVLLKESEAHERNNWLKEVEADLNNCMQGKLSLEEMGQNVCTCLVGKLDAAVGAFYVTSDDNSAIMVGHCALTGDVGVGCSIAPGEGLVGQVLVDKKQLVVRDLPEHYMTVESALIDSSPTELIIFPFIWNGCVEGVVELGLLQELSPLQLALLENESESIAINLSAAKSRL